MNSEKAEKQHQRMTKSNIRPLILRLAFPSTVGMFVTALYSLVDALYVSELGTLAGAAVGVTFAIQALIQAVGYTLGTGAGSLMSRSFGERRDQDAGSYATVSFLISLVIGTLIMLCGLFFGGPIMRILGASDSVYPYALSYSRYLFISAPFMCASFVLSLVLRAEGKAVYSAVGLTVGSVLNIILDPILIYRLGMGIAGASLATLISQVVCLAVLLSAYLLGYSQIRLFHSFSVRQILRVGKITVAGLPSSFRQGLIALSTVLLNHAAVIWGDAAVAAISVVSRIFLLSFSICLGIGQGLMPVAGYNYGFKKRERVFRAYRFSAILASLTMLVISIPLFLFASELIAVFRNDPEVIAIGTMALRAQSAVLVLHGVITCTIMLLQAIGKQFAAALLACARQGLFFLPLIWWFPKGFGIQSIIYVQPLSDALTFLFAIPFVIYIYKHLKERTAKQTVSLPYGQSSD